MAVVNVMERMVRDVLESEIQSGSYSWCACSLCRDDIVALALNHLPPRYVSSDVGMAYVKLKFLDRQAGSDVVRAVTKAVFVVGERPRHGHSRGFDRGTVNG